MKILIALLVALTLTSCQQSTDTPQTETAQRKKTTAEKAFDAGQNARQKAERIKAEQEKKAKDAVDETNQ